MIRVLTRIAAPLLLVAALTVGLSGCHEHCYIVHMNQTENPAPWDYHYVGPGGYWTKWTRYGVVVTGWSVNRRSPVHNTLACAQEWADGNPIDTVERVLR
jgi:hypothetical protein